MMKLKNCLLIMTLATFATNITATRPIKIVLSVALTDNYFEERKQQYIEAFSILTNLGYPDFYIVEAIKGQGPTFLDLYCDKVFYSKINNPNLNNKGINEGITLLDGLAHFNFDPEDMVIKLTGRYHLMSDYFLKAVQNNLDCDALVHLDDYGNLHTLGYAMKYKYMKEMYESLPYDHLEQHMINVEKACNDFVTQKVQEGVMKVIYMDKLDIKANVAGSSVNGTAQGVFYF